MQIPSELKDNVVFLGVMDGETYRPKATGFIVGTRMKYGPVLQLVTAAHVIFGLRSRGHSVVYLRTHLPGLEPQPIPLTDGWYFHPDAEREPTDVAVCPVAFQGFTGNEIVILDPESFVTPKNIADREWGVGDEIVVVGLFRNHYGRSKNVPIVRIGSLAALPDEPVNTQCGFIEAYLVELHSIGGLSGSPVYIHHPPFRVGKDGKPNIITGARLNLLGLMQGHFDIPNLREDAVVEDAGESGSINTGVGVVVPAHKILETINHPDLKALREALDAEHEAGNLGSSTISKVQQK